MLVPGVGSADRVGVVEECIEEDFGDAVLGGQEWEQRAFVRCRFVDADLRGLRTRGCRFTA